jgi:REP element-mobilizing transposase RayT
MNQTPIKEGRYYHIYNRGINSGDLFFENENYLHFLRLYDKYIDPIAETYAWCLLKNHFHLLVYIKNQEEIDPKLLSYSTVEKPKMINASKQFSNLFNAYTQAINKRHNRTGSLFEKNFKRKQIINKKYFQNMIFYIHNNPVSHGFADKIFDYPWSSYLSILSNKPTKLKRERVINMFENVDNFKYYHSSKHNIDNIEEFIIE